MGRLATILVCLLAMTYVGTAGCGNAEEPAEAESPKKQTVGDRTGDVIEDAEFVRAADRQRLDLQSVTVQRAASGLQVSFETAEQPGDHQIERLVVSNGQGTRSAVIEAVFRDGRVRAFHRPPSGERREAALSRRGGTVTVTAPLDSLTSKQGFRWHASVISLRGAPELVDRLPAPSRRLRFPAR